MFTKEIKPFDISLAAEVSYCDKGFKYIVKIFFHKQKHNKSICSSWTKWLANSLARDAIKKVTSNGYEITFHGTGLQGVNGEFSRNVIVLVGISSSRHCENCKNKFLV